MGEDKGMLERINQIARETGVPTKKIMDLLFILQPGEPVENNELLQRVGVSRNVLNQIKDKLSGFFEPPSEFTSLTDEGRSGIEEIGTFLKDKEESLINLDNKKVEHIVKLLEKYREKRPEQERKYDQFTATQETTAKRACLMDFFEDIRGKRILFLGDDDFTSVAVASFGIAESIHVLDIDKRILEGIKFVSSEEKFRINTLRYDARVELPQECRRGFDVVFTDPPYTSDGIALFLSRAIDALDLRNQAARVYFCYGNSDRAKERFLPIYETVFRLGLMARWVFDKFNRYEKAESIGSASSLFVCDVTPKTKALIKGTFNGKIYTSN